jgi:hypothetical protein
MGSNLGDQKDETPPLEVLAATYARTVRTFTELSDYLKSPFPVQDDEDARMVEAICIDATSAVFALREAEVRFIARPSMLTQDGEVLLAAVDDVRANLSEGPTGNLAAVRTSVSGALDECGRKVNALVAEAIAEAST